MGAELQNLLAIEQLCRRLTQQQESDGILQPSTSAESK